MIKFNYYNDRDDNMNAEMDIKIDYEKVGFRIGQRRRELKLKQKELAEMINISPKYLSNLETGKRHVSIEMLALLCASLNTTYDYFMLGYIRKDIADNITDNLKMCSEDDKKVILALTEICSKKNK